MTEGDAGDLVRDGGVRSMTGGESTGAGALLYENAGELSLDEAYSTEERALHFVGFWLDRWIVLRVGTTRFWRGPGWGMGQDI